MTLPVIQVSRRCWRQIAMELDRVAPTEGIVVPLVGLAPCDPERNPCATMTLADIASLTIADVVLVPEHRQQNELGRVSLLANTDDLVGAQIEMLTKRFPRLRACAYLHSHPFARGRTRPSRGPRCDVEGHMVPLLECNRAAGLAASFSFIACRDPNGRRWRLQGFALDERGEVVDLGFARTVDDSHPAVTDVLAPALSRRPRARALLRHWRRELRRRGFKLDSRELFDGWTRMLVHLSAARVLVVLIPIDFPERNPQAHVVDRASGHDRALPRESLTSPNSLVHAARRMEEVHEHP